ncbi:MAG: transcriptional regulator [Gammaproteobacteria bacterium]|nr:MAG: transcriptional regulator [Gammaproteobacteria bacterium]
MSTKKEKKPADKRLTDKNLDTQLGNRLTVMRLEKGYSQRKLAQLAGLTNTAISSIENGKNSPSINTLQRILTVLGSDLASFFATYQEQQQHNIRIVVKPEELINIGNGGAVLNLVHNGNPSRQLAMLIETYPPHSQTEEKISHEGEEVGTVISGAVTIILDEKSYELRAGDSYVFDTSVPHTFINTSNEEAHIVSAHSPATY